MEAQDINKKIDITWAAVDIYIEQGRVSIPDLVNVTKTSASEIYVLFPNKKAILAYFYPALIYQYWAMIGEIDGFEDFSVSEKFSNFIYTSFDMMSEKLPFVEKTFTDYAFSLTGDTDFSIEVTALFKDFLTSDGNIAVSAAFFMNNLFYQALTTQYLLMVKYWVKDESENKDRSLALADKLTALFEEIVYNKSVDKTFDLAKFIFGSKSMNFDDWFPKWDFCQKDEDIEDEEIEIEVTEESEEEEKSKKGEDADE